MLRTLLPLTLALLVPDPAPLRGGIPWEADWAAARERARTENRVVFLAVNMDGERANDRLAKEVYREKAVVALAERTVPLVASAFAHGSGVCPRFGGLRCAEHQQVDIRARDEVLQPDADGFVVAPQHVFLAPDGAVLLSVPYEVTADELEWCLAEALRKHDPEAEVRTSSGARPPKRLVMDGLAPTEGAAGPGPPTREEVLELLREIKKGTVEDRGSAVRRILTADEDEAREFAIQELRRSGGGGKRGGGGGATSNEAGSGPWARQEALVRQIGRLSPPSWWVVIEEFAGNGDEDLRAEVAAALEQLQAPESKRLVATALRKERVPALEGAWLRALASVAPEDRASFAALEKAIRKHKEGLVRVQALVGLGWLAPSEERNALLLEFLGGEREELARAAALGLALTREADHLEVLKARLEGAAPGLAGDLEAAITVLEKGSLEPLGAPVANLCRDEVPRERFFGMRR
jgi:hypothetical protein